MRRCCGAFELADPRPRPEWPFERLRVDSLEWFGTGLMLDSVRLRARSRFSAAKAHDPNRGNRPALAIGD